MMNVRCDKPQDVAQEPRKPAEARPPTGNAYGLTCSEEHVDTLLSEGESV